GDRNARRRPRARTRPPPCAPRSSQAIGTGARPFDVLPGEPRMTTESTLVPMRDYQARHFRFAPSADGKVATITLDRPEKKNPLTFAAYAELRDLFRGLVYASDVKAVVVTGAGGNFCSGGDVHEIIGPLTKMSAPELLAFTRMTGDLVLAMRKCPQPIVAAIDGICAGAGGRIALASAP